MEILMAQVFGALFGFLAIGIGAFGAHALKKVFTPDQMVSFETGVKYLMYHAILLLILSFNLSFTTTLESSITYLIIGGTVFFSFSIFALCISGASGNKWRFLGPVTPIGGLLLLAGWGLLFVYFIKNLF